MNTVAWLEILVFVTVAVGACMYHFGHAIGRQQERIDAEARLAAMRRHPSNPHRSQQ
jgi:uncharacterized protein (DUF2126 family)